MFKKRSFLLSAVYLVSLNASAFGLGDAVNTLNAVTDAVNKVNSVPKETISKIPTTPASTIPKQFLGDWHKDCASVDREMDNNGIISIREKEISWYESHDEVQSTIDTAQGLELNVKSCYEGGCDDAITKQILKLNTPDSLSITKANSETQTLQRCPPPSTAAVTTHVAPVNKDISNSSGEILFLCKTKNGKTITLTDSGSTIDYSFGKSGTKPEIDLKVPRDKVRSVQFSGPFGRSVYEVRVPNGNLSYNVIFETGRGDKGDFESYSVSVMKGEKEIANVACKGKADPMKLDKENLNIEQAPNNGGYE